MSTLLDKPVRQQSSAADRLRTTMAAVRVSMSWFGTRKSLTAEQKAEAAEPFNAEAKFLSAGKKLLDTTHPAFKAVTAVRGKVIAYWKSMSLPYPEAGIRLIRQQKIDEFASKMREFQEELAEAVQALDRRYHELKTVARQRLGSLYNSSDYPPSLDGLFEIGFDFPSVEPPDYLQQLNPELYQEECQRVQSRFDEAVRLAEEAFTAELAKLVSHLTERLNGQEDGRSKIFRDSAIENLTEFFTRFRQLNVRSNEQLDRLVADAQRVIRGVEPQSLRDNVDLRQHVATEMSRVQSVLDGLLVDRPRRRYPPPSTMMSTTMELIIKPGGAVRCIYGEAISLAALGSPAITRASHVEPDQQGRWWVDLSPVGGAVLGPFVNRSEALAAEHAWLDDSLAQSRGWPIVDRRFPSPSLETF